MEILVIAGRCYEGLVQGRWNQGRRTWQRRLNSLENCTLQLKKYTWLDMAAIRCWLLEFYVLATSKVISGVVTVHTHGYFKVLPEWKTRPAVHDLISHSVTFVFRVCLEVNSEALQARRQKRLTSAPTWLSISANESCSFNCKWRLAMGAAILLNVSANQSSSFNYKWLFTMEVCHSRSPQV